MTRRIVYLDKRSAIFRYISITLIIALLWNQVSFAADEMRSCLAVPNSFNPPVTIVLDADGTPSLDTETLTSDLFERAPAVFFRYLICAALVKGLDTGKTRTLIQQTMGDALFSMPYEFNGLIVRDPHGECILPGLAGEEDLIFSLNEPDASTHPRRLSFKDGENIGQAWIRFGTLSKRRASASLQLLQEQDGIVYYGGDAYSRLNARLKAEQETAQEAVEQRLSGLHGEIVESVERGDEHLIGMMEEGEVDDLEKLVDEWSKDDHIIFVTESNPVLAETCLQALTGREDWNKTLKANGQPQIHFIDSNNAVAAQNFIKQGHVKPGTENVKVRIVHLGSNQDDANADVLKQMLARSYGRRLDAYVTKETNLTTEKIGLLTAGLVKREHVRAIYDGAVSAYTKWKNLHREDASGYKAYKFAATQIRYAETGQNVSVFTVFSKKFYKFSIWLAEQFSQHVGNSELSIAFSGEVAPDHRHATFQGQVQSKGFPYTEEIEQLENKGFITTTFLNPYEERTGEVVVVPEDANPQYAGHNPTNMMTMDRESQRLALQRADRPIVDIDFAARTAEDLGRVLHFGQISAVMAGRLAGHKKEDDQRASLEQAVDEHRAEEKPAQTIPDGTLEVQQNFLTFEEEHKLGGAVGSVIQASLDQGDRKLFEYLVTMMGRLVGEKSGVDQVVRNFQGGHDLVHLDPKHTREAIDVSESMAKNCKDYKRVYVCAMGGSVSGKYLIDMLNLVRGPEVIFVTGYEEDRLRLIRQDIEQNPDDVAVVAITKSGTTTEVEVNSRVLLQQLRDSLSESHKGHFLAITDRQVGDMRELVNKEGYASIDHPEHGGRFTMLTPLGLLFYFLKGGDRAALERAVDVWEGDMATLSKLSKKLAEYRKAMDLDTDMSDQGRIKVMSDIVDEISTIPGIWPGFLSTFVNEIHQVAPELRRDTELALAISGGIQEMVNPANPFYQQMKVESWGKVGKRFYAIIAAGVDSIMSLWNRITSNPRAYVTLYGETAASSESEAVTAEKEQALWDTMVEDLDRQGVPVISVRTGPMSIANLVATMRMTYLQLAVSAAMYEEFALSSEGQPGVEMAKAIFRAILAEVNNNIEEAVRVYRARLEAHRPVYAPHQINALIEERLAELKAEGVTVPEMNFAEVERIIEIPMALSVSMGMKSDLAEFIEKIVVNESRDCPGLATVQVRDEVAAMQKGETAGETVSKRITDIVSHYGVKQVSKLIIDGKSQTVGDGTGKWIVRATSMESWYNRLTGTANGTNIGIYEKGTGKELKLLASIRVQWGSRLRVTVSNGLRTQDFDLLDDDGRLVEVSKAQEDNFLLLPLKGDYVSLGGDSKKRPPGMQTFENEVVFPSMKFKIRHADAHTSDGYLMLNKQGKMTGWMPIAEAIELGQGFEGASGAAMVMTEKGLMHVSDIPMTEEMLTDDEQIYVYMGVKNLVQQAHLWMNFLDIKSLSEPAGSAAIFAIMNELESISVGDEVALKAAAVMLLVRLQEGLNELPKEEKLKGQVKEIVGLLRQRVENLLEKLNPNNVVIEELKTEYLTLTLPRRRANSSKYVLLGHPTALMRAAVPAGPEMLHIYELERAFERTTTWDIMTNIKDGLTTVYPTNADKLDRTMQQLKERYKVNAGRTKPDPEPRELFADLIEEDGETVQNYMNNEVHIPKSADLDAGTAAQIKAEMVSISNMIFETYLKPIPIPEIIEDEKQKEILDDLRKVEPSIFYTHNGVEYIHSLQWVKGNLKEDKFRPVINVSGDVSSRLDYIFNSVFKFTLRGKTDVIISEEDRAIVFGIGGGKGQDRYRIVLLLDPIDGSSQIGEGGTFGSIFKLGFLRPGQDIRKGDFDPRKQAIFGFQLQYGPGTQITMVNLENKDGKPEAIHFELQGTRGPEGKEEEENFAAQKRKVEEQVFKKLFLYPSIIDADMQLEWDGLLPQADSSTGIHMALGGSLSDSIMEDGLKEFMMWMVKTYGYEPDYTGALVNDIIKIILATFKDPRRAGFLHTYPRVGAYKEGRYRYAFEGIFYAKLFQVLGGEVIDGDEPLLNTKIEGDTPSKKHVPFYAGSGWITKLRMSWADYLKTHPIESATDEKMQAAWESFLKYYNTETKRLMKEIEEYSGQDGVETKTEEDIRRALLTWDGEHINFAKFLKMTGEEVYKILFPPSSEGPESDGDAKGPAGDTPADDERPVDAPASTPKDAFYAAERLETVSLLNFVKGVVDRIRVSVMAAIGQAGVGEPKLPAYHVWQKAPPRSMILFADTIVDSLGFFDLEEALSDDFIMGNKVFAGGSIVLYGTPQKCKFLEDMIQNTNKLRARGKKIQVLTINKETEYESEVEEIKAVVREAGQIAMKAATGKRVEFVGVIKGQITQVVDITDEICGTIDMPIVVMDNLPGVHSFKMALLTALSLKYNAAPDKWLYILRPIERLTQETIDILRAKLELEISA